MLKAKSLHYINSCYVMLNLFQHLSGFENHYERENICWRGFTLKNFKSFNNRIQRWKDAETSSA